MTFQPRGSETRLQLALRALAEAQALVDQHNRDLMTLIEAGYCVRVAMAINIKLREEVAQSRRDVIWARDRIRFGLDEAGAEPVSLQLPKTTTIDCKRHASMPDGMLVRRTVAAT